MSNNKMKKGHGMGHGGMGPVEKAKDFKGTIKQLSKHLAKYKISLLLVLICAIIGTVFTIVGPKILGNATNKIFDGLVDKITGVKGGGIDFTSIGRILIFLICLYFVSLIFSFIQGYIMSGISQKLSYDLRKKLSEKISRMPMKYFDKKTHGEVLSRFTNDIDTLNQSLNQSLTQLITSVTTVIGVLIMMLSISVTMTIAALVILLLLL